MKNICRLQPEAHMFDDRSRLRVQPMELKPDENGEKSMVVFKCSHMVDGEEVRYLEMWDTTDLPKIMSSEQVGKLSSFDQAKLFASRKYVVSDAQGRVNFGKDLVEYLGDEKSVVTVPIIRECCDGNVKGIAVWTGRDYVGHIDSKFAVKTR